MYATLTVSITLGKKLGYASIQPAIGDYECRSNSIHLRPRELGLAQDEVQYKHDKWCSLHRQVCRERGDDELSLSPLLFQTRIRQMLLQLIKANNSGAVLGVISGRRIKEGQRDGAASRWCK